jgi:hypothetical protein
MPSFMPCARPVRDEPARPSLRSLHGRPIAGADVCRGVACVTGVFHRPTMLEGFSRFRGMTYTTGAFAKFFRLFEAGKIDVELLLNHDEEMRLTDTRRALHLWQDAGKVCFNVRASRPGGRKVLRSLGMFGRRFGVSVGIVPVKYFDRVERISATMTDHTLIVSEARICEVSLLWGRGGACPGTYAKLR